jgi:hypothetical protein
MNSLIKNIPITKTLLKQFVLTGCIALSSAGLLITPAHSDTTATGSSTVAATTATNPTNVKPREHHTYTAIYQAAYKGLPLQATHRLERAGSDWFFSSIASGFFGQIEENATFNYTNTGIIPKHYSYLRSVLGHDKSYELIYNQDDKIVAGNNDENKWKVTLEGGELDQGTYALALRDDVARGLQDMCYAVIDEDETDRNCFRVTGTETIDTALGKIEAIVVERVRKANSPRRTRFWFAPSLDFSLARLEHQEKEQTAYSLEITYFREEPDSNMKKATKKAVTQ